MVRSGGGVQSERGGLVVWSCGDGRVEQGSGGKISEVASSRLQAVGGCGWKVFGRESRWVEEEG